MEKKRPLILELEAHHEGCPDIDLTSKFKDASTRFLLMAGSDKKNTYIVDEFHSPEIKKFLEKYGKHRNVKNLDVIRIDKDRAIVRFASKKETFFVPAATEAGCIPLPFTGTYEGIDRYTILAPSPKSFDKLSKVLEGKFDFRLKSKHFLKPKDQLALDAFNTTGFLKLAFASKILTEKQAEAFELACKRGYYDRPKKATLEELGREFGISKSTYAELLSKAEAKLLPILNEILILIK